MKKYLRNQLLFEHWQDEAIEHMALYYGVSKSEVVRQAWNYYFLNNRARKWKDLMFDARKKWGR